MRRLSGKTGTAIWRPMVRPALVWLACGCAVWLTGCASSVTGTAPLQMVGEGTAVPSAESMLRPPASPAPVAGQAAPVTWRSSQLAAQASEPLPAMADRVNAVLLARRRAHTRAQEQLASQVAELPAGPAGKVMDILRREPERLDRVESVIRSDSRIETGGANGQGNYEIRVVLPLEGVAAALKGAIPESPVRAQLFGQDTVRETSMPGAVPKSEKEMRRAAYEAALHSARSQLLEAVRDQRIDANRTVGALMETDPTVRSLVERTVADAPAGSVAEPVAGRCRVLVEYDLDRLLRRLRTRY